MGYLGQVWLTRKKKSGWVMGQPDFTSSKKNRVRVKYFSGQVESENFDPFCHV